MITSFLLGLVLASPGPRVAVHELGGWGDASVRQALTAQVRSALQRAGVFTLIATEEQAALDDALVKQLEEGCEGDCLEALGQALQAQHLVRGTLGKVGNSITLDLKVVDLGTRKNLRSASRRVDGAVEDLLPLIDGLAAELSGLERMPVEEVEGVAILPLQAGDLPAAEQTKWSGILANTTDRSARFRAIFAGDRLARRLSKGLLKQAKACGEANCVASIGKAVKMPYALMAQVEQQGEVYRVSVLMAKSEDGRRMAMETMTAPDRHSVPSALRAVLTSAITRSFDPDAPQLHSAMKISVIAGVDPKLRAKRRAMLRYGGLGLVVVGGGVGLMGYTQTAGAASRLEAGHAGDPDAFAADWQAAKSGRTLQGVGVGVLAVGAAVFGWSFAQ